MITVWTLQHPSVLRTLQEGHTYAPTKAFIDKHGEFAFDDDEVEWPQHRAYAWMHEEYAKRVEPISTERGLIWVWVRPKPDMRKLRHERPIARLTLRIRPSRVLASDHAAWHRPLNRSPVAPLKTRRGSWSAYLDWDESTYGWPKEKVESTWPRIFDPKGFEEEVQGVIGEIRPSDVVKYELFT